MLGRTVKAGICLLLFALLGMVVYVFWNSEGILVANSEKSGNPFVESQDSAVAPSDQGGTRRPCTYEGETWPDGVIVSIEGGKLCDDGTWATPQEIPASERLQASPVAGKSPLKVIFTVGEGQEGSMRIADGGVSLDFGDGSPTKIVVCPQDKRKIHDACSAPVRITHAYERGGTYTVRLWKGSFVGPYVRAQTVITVGL